MQVAHVSVKEVVLPFSKFPGADMLLGPEMRSTGALPACTCLSLHPKVLQKSNGLPLESTVDNHNRSTSEPFALSRTALSNMPCVF